ncbi:DUF983 domain-containing protein [Kordiimonas aestuarii]|uniref:DUF983 domain-containing protein n=1 Tax=Kordiimonas aestuarii TaxID=1005925 RepID=UPI0021D2E65E|nr:DUF983 domain-containing protein [Kordiimonas aestuarii]
MAGTAHNNNSETDREQHSRSVSPYKAGLHARCPNCGEGPLFVNGLAVRDACDVCGFDLSSADPGDGAQVFVILIMGALSALLGFIVMGALRWPLWAVAVTLFTFIMLGSIWMLRVFKALLIALQFHHDARQGTPGEGNRDE